MQKILGIIGCGNMGQAILGGILKANIFSSENIWVSNRNEKKLIKVLNQYRVHITTDNNEVAQAADILILAVKPNLYALVIEEIRNQIKNNVMVVTIAAGKAMEEIEKLFKRQLKVVRVMPNTPVLVGEGMSAICSNKMVTQEELEEIIKIFGSFGKTELVSENLMDVVTSISGSSPAYVYMMIEAMADAAVLDGMPRDQAYKMAAQAVLGSARMVLETEKHPGVLKDMVCSPGGTTIEAVAVLEKKGLRSAIIEAMKACTQKSIQLSK